MKDNKLIHYNVARRSEADARLARIIASRRELCATAHNKREA